jgi:hypothetical protein
MAFTIGFNRLTTNEYHHTLSLDFIFPIAPHMLSF